MNTVSMFDSNGTDFATDQCVWKAIGHFTGCDGICYVGSADFICAGETDCRLFDWLLPGKWMALQLTIQFVILIKANNFDSWSPF